MQRHFLILGVSSCFVLRALNAQAGEDAIAPEIQEKLQSIYSNADSKLRDVNVDLKTAEIAHAKPLNGPVISVLKEAWIPKTYTIETEGGAFLQIWANGLQLRSVLDSSLWQKMYGKEIVQQVPDLNIAKAIATAKAYLNQFQIPLTSDLELTNVDFNQGPYQACWEVRWTRVVGEYSWDDFNPISRESLVVIFYEKQGLVSLTNDIYSPSPKQLDVLITREQAISKAAQCAPLVESTPFYKSARIGGFAVDGLKSCKLKIAIPNYLLDPQRANWLPAAPPNETRLCWVTQFTTVDSKANQRDSTTKLIPPDIVIYLDAATGECIGANFN